MRPNAFNLRERSNPEKSELRCKIVNAKADEPAEFHIDSIIGDFVDWSGDQIGVAARDIKSFLSDNKGREVKLFINSEGGEAWEGMVMHNALLSHDAKTTAVIDGLAFSAASFVPLACDEVAMYELSSIGIHRAWTFAMGNAKAMQDAMEWLLSLDEHLINLYSQKTGADRQQVEEWMDGTDDGTIFRASEAKEIGFADTIIENASRNSRQSKSQLSNLADSERRIRLHKAKSRLTQKTA